MDRPQISTLFRRIDHALPCRSSISAAGQSDTEVSKAARATMKLPAGAMTS
jgi:hypothetical protein